MNSRLGRVFGRSSRLKRTTSFDRSVVARFLPYRPKDRCWVVRPAQTAPADRSDGPLPLPPPDCRENYGAADEEYLFHGKQDVETLTRLLGDAGVELSRCRRVLDFGCATGRMIRWFREWADEQEVWGVDINSSHILWCQEHLSPPFRFVTCTTFPHLPFEDNYFDVVYASSVFSHIADLSDAWLMELRRIVRRGGNVFATVHDENTIEYLRQNPHRELSQLLSQVDARDRFWEGSYGMFAVNPGSGSNVFYDAGFLRRRWGRLMDVLSMTPHAFGYQTGVLLAKR